MYGIKLTFDLHPNISMQVLHTVFYTFSIVLPRRIWLTFMSFTSSWSFSPFSWRESLIQKCYFWEKLDAYHHQGSQARFLTHRWRAKNVVLVQLVLLWYELKMPCKYYTLIKVLRSQWRPLLHPPHIFQWPSIGLWGYFLENHHAAIFVVLKVFRFVLLKCLWA